MISVPFEKSYRLINHGVSVMISSKFKGAQNIMSVSWVCPLDYDKISVVIDRGAFSFDLIANSGKFAINVPFAAQAALVKRMGETSMHDDPDKIAGVELFYQSGFETPFIAGCAAWLACELIPEKSVNEKYDMLLAQVVGAWADDRVFRDGRWDFTGLPNELRTLHYVAGGQFYATGESVNLE